MCLYAWIPEGYQKLWYNLYIIVTARIPCIKTDPELTLAVHAKSYPRRQNHLVLTSLWSRTSCFGPYRLYCLISVLCQSITTFCGVGESPAVSREMSLYSPTSFYKTSGYVLFCRAIGFYRYFKVDRRTSLLGIRMLSIGIPFLKLLFLFRKMSQICR